MKHRSFTIIKNPKPGILPFDQDPTMSVADYGENGFQEKTLHEVTLGNVGPPYIENLETVQIDIANIIQLIIKERNNCERIFGGRMNHVIVGFDQMQELDIEFEQQQRMFGIPARVEIQKGGLFRVCNMTIHICPWFNGILVLPELKDKWLPDAL